MQSRKPIVKSIIPLRIYKTPNAVYLTCMSKLSKDAFNVEGDKQLIVKAVYDAMVESIRCPTNGGFQSEGANLMRRSRYYFRNVSGHHDGAVGDTHIVGQNFRDNDENWQLDPRKVALYEAAYNASREEARLRHASREEARLRHARQRRAEAYWHHVPPSPSFAERTPYSLLDCIKIVFVVSFLLAAIYLFKDGGRLVWRLIFSARRWFNAR